MKRLAILVSSLFISSAYGQSLQCNGSPITERRACPPCSTGTQTTRELLCSTPTDSQGNRCGSKTCDGTCGCTATPGPASWFPTTTPQRKEPSRWDQMNAAREQVKDWYSIGGEAKCKNESNSQLECQFENTGPRQYFEIESHAFGRPGGGPWMETVVEWTDWLDPNMAWERETCSPGRINWNDNESSQIFRCWFEGGNSTYRFRVTQYNGNAKAVRVTARLVD